jgi:anhydro-N-acetylmuramic acid kinase
MADLYIGLMSGTSMDGIDAILVDFSSGQPTILATHDRGYPPHILEQLEAALLLDDLLAPDLTQLDKAVGECFASAVEELLHRTGVSPAAVTAIGSHGQTIRHEPNAPTPYSLQIGDPRTIAAMSGIDVIADFRRADIEAGGQGAPLVPAFHRAVFSTPREYRTVVNIGGIANITTLPSDASHPVTGFDTGPGNTLLDGWIRRHQATAMDRNGDWAAAGQIHAALLNDLMRDPYFNATPPKSTGREYFNLGWLLDRRETAGISPQDIQATLCDLTARTIATAVLEHAGDTQRLLVCGGGVHNRHMMHRLAVNLPNITVESTENYGLDPDWVEAAAFAWLAKQNLDGKPGNIPEVTGASRAVKLGYVFKAGPERAHPA